MNEERFVLALAQHLVHEVAACVALLTEDPPLAHARVHEQAERERQVSFPRKVADGLGAALFLQEEIVLVESFYNLAVRVPDRGKHIHDFYAGGEAWCVLLATQDPAGGQKRYRGLEQPASGEGVIWRVHSFKTMPGEGSRLHQRSRLRAGRTRSLSVLHLFFDHFGEKVNIPYRAVDVRSNADAGVFLVRH